MAKRPEKRPASAALDFSSPAALLRFRKLADDFNKQHNASRDTALALLKKEGILTASGKLTKRYSGK